MRSDEIAAPKYRRSVSWSIINTYAVSLGDKKTFWAMQFTSTCLPVSACGDLSAIRMSLQRTEHLAGPRVPQLDGPVRAAARQQVPLRGEHDVVDVPGVIGQLPCQLAGP